MLALDQQFSFRGQRIAWGSLGDGPPLVLVHGFPWSSQCWRRIAPWLAGRHTVYFFDMLGTGQSAKPLDQDVSAAVQSELLAALLDHWGLSSPQVVGHDFGGLAALRTHFLHGVSYDKLHLIDAVAVLPSGSPFYAHVKQYEAAFAGLPDYAHAALFRAYIQQAAHHTLSDEQVAVYFAPWSDATGKAAFYRQIAQSDEGHITEVQARYQKPEFEVHLSWGDKDTFIPVSQGEELARLINADSLSVIPEAAHLIQEDAPEAVLGSLLSRL